MQHTSLTFRFPALQQNSSALSSNQNDQDRILDASLDPQFSSFISFMMGPSSQAPSSLATHSVQRSGASLPPSISQQIPQQMPLARLSSSSFSNHPHHSGLLLLNSMRRDSDASSVVAVRATDSESDFQQVAPFNLEEEMDHKEAVPSLSALDDKETEVEELEDSEEVDSSENEEIDDEAETVYEPSSASSKKRKPVAAAASSSSRKKSKGNKASIVHAKKIEFGLMDSFKSVRRLLSDDLKKKLKTISSLIDLTFEKINCGRWRGISRNANNEVGAALKRVLYFCILKYMEQASLDAIKEQLINLMKESRDKSEADETALPRLAKQTTFICTLVEKFKIDPASMTDGCYLTGSKRRSPQNRQKDFIRNPAFENAIKTHFDHFSPQQIKSISRIKSTLVQKRKKYTQEYLEQLADRVKGFFKSKKSIQDFMNILGQQVQRSNTTLFLSELEIFQDLSKLI